MPSLRLMVVLTCVCVGSGCGPGQVPGGGSGGAGSTGDEATGGEDPTTDDGASSSSGGDEAPLDVDGCPGDIDLYADAPRAEGADSLDPSTLDADPRFEDAFCDAYCPMPPDGYERLFCEPTNDEDVLPPNGSGDDEGGSSDGSTSEGGSGEGGSSSSSTTGDPQLIEIRCYYWPGCM